MPRLPVVDGHETLRALARAGFLLDGVEGSHHIVGRGRFSSCGVSARLLPYAPTGTPHRAGGGMRGPRQTMRPSDTPQLVGSDCPRESRKSLIRDAGLTVEQFCDFLK